MDENELVKALDSLRVEALRNEQMSSGDALKSIQLAVGYAEQLAAKMQVPIIKELVIGCISIEKTYSAIRTNNNWDIVFFCGSVLLQWKNNGVGAKL